MMVTSRDLEVGTLLVDVGRTYGTSTISRIQERKADDSGWWMSDLDGTRTGGYGDGPLDSLLYRGDVVPYSIDGLIGAVKIARGLRTLLDEV